MLRRTSVKISAGTILAVCFFWLYLRVVSGHTLQHLTSPDGRNIAQVRTSTTGSAVDVDYISVDLQSRWNPFRHEVFGGLDGGTHLTISWTDSQNLFITCAKCDNLGQTYIGEKGESIEPEHRFSTCSKCGNPRYAYKEDKWRDITIHYVIQ
jgi:hypothetical protein